MKKSRRHLIAKNAKDAEKRGLTTKGTKSTKFRTGEIRTLRVLRG